MTPPQSPRSRSAPREQHLRAASEPQPDDQLDPSQTPSPSPSAAAASGTGSSGAEFFEDHGPDFDPEHAPAAPEPELEEAPGVLEQWSEEQVRSLLEIQGNATHMLLRVGPEDTETWRHTDNDLKAIAPPLCRILNRYDATRAAAAAGDEISLVFGLGTYGWRNYALRRQLIAAHQEQGPQPVTGVAAEPGSGPEDDPEWQRLHDAPPALTPKGTHR